MQIWQVSLSKGFSFSFKQDLNPLIHHAFEYGKAAATGLSEKWSYS